MNRMPKLCFLIGKVVHKNPNTITFQNYQYQKNISYLFEQEIHLFLLIKRCPKQYFYFLEYQ